MNNLNRLMVHFVAAAELTMGVEGVSVELSVCCGCRSVVGVSIMNAVKSFYVFVSYIRKINVSNQIQEQYIR